MHVLLFLKGGFFFFDKTKGVKYHKPFSGEMHAPFLNKLFLSVITSFNIDMCNRGTTDSEAQEVHTHLFGIFLGVLTINNRKTTTKTTNNFHQTPLKKEVILAQVS